MIAEVLRELDQLQAQTAKTEERELVAV